MARTYLVQVTAGAHAWTVTDEDMPDYGLMDPLTIGWSIPDVKNRPAQPDIMVCGFSVIAPTALELDDLLLGDPVGVAVTFGPTDKPAPDVVFYGRVAQGEAAPHPRGMLYRFTCADMTADLSGYDIGADPFEVQQVNTRMSAMLTRAGLAEIDLVRDPVVTAADPNLMMERIDQPNAASLLASTVGMWDDIALAGLNELASVAHRVILAPHPGPVASEQQLASNSGFDTNMAGWVQLALMPSNTWSAGQIVTPAVTNPGVIRDAAYPIARPAATELHLRTRVTTTAAGQVRLGVNFGTTAWNAQLGPYWAGETQCVERFDTHMVPAAGTYTFTTVIDPFDIPADTFGWLAPHTVFWSGLSGAIMGGRVDFLELGWEGTGYPYRFALDVVPDAYVASAEAPLPATFGHYWPDPGGWGLAMDPDDRAAGVIDACVVEHDSHWSAIQPNIANRAAVTWFYTSSFAPPDPEGNIADRGQAVGYVTELPPPGQPPVTVTRNTNTIGEWSGPGADTPSNAAAIANWQRLGGMMIPPPQNPAGWGPDTFRWLLYKDPIGLERFPIIFPRHDATNQPTPRVLRTACYVRPIVVVDIPPEWNAADAYRDWIGGQLASVTLTIENGSPVVDFQLVPTLPEAANPATGANNWNSGTGTWNARTGVWNDLIPGRPAFRWSDTALVGRVWNDLHPQSWNMYRLARGS